MIDIQYLESTENLKKNINASQGWKPSSGQAEAITACLRQGRLFFEAAKRAPLEIRPLELYYGASAYAKAVVLSMDRRLSLNSLQQSHGVCDKSAHNARLSELTVVIDRRGTFQELNDSIRTFNRVRSLAMGGSREEFIYPTATSEDLAGLRLSLRDIFGRLPRLGKLYRATFDERENIDRMQLIGPDAQSGWTLQIPVEPWDGDFETMLERINGCKTRMPFLQSWTVTEANTVAGASLTFKNAIPLKNEMIVGSFRRTAWGFSAQSPQPERYFQVTKTSLGPLISAPGEPGAGYYVQPISGRYIALQSLQFLALHLLSSLVRYRPATWMHALSRSANNGRSADDSMLALIEAFMDNTQTDVPKFVAETIRPNTSN